MYISLVFETKGVCSIPGTLNIHAHKHTDTHTHSAYVFSTQSHKLALNPIDQRRPTEICFSILFIIDFLIVLFWLPVIVYALNAYENYIH